MFSPGWAGGPRGPQPPPSAAWWSSAGPIPRATVTATAVGRGTITKTETSDEAIYTFDRLPVGRYELRVDAGGVQSAKHSAFELVLNQVAKVDIALVVGQVSTTLE